MRVGATAIVPIVTEHPRAIPRLESLCGADPRVVAIMCGNEDLAAAIGARRVKDESGAMLEVFRVVRALALLAGSAAGVGVIDSPVVEIAATEVLERESAEAAAMGRPTVLAEAVLQDAQDVADRTVTPAPRRCGHQPELGTTTRSTHSSWWKLE